MNLVSDLFPWKKFRGRDPICFNTSIQLSVVTFLKCTMHPLIEGTFQN